MAGLPFLLWSSACGFMEFGVWLGPMPRPRTRSGISLSSAFCRVCRPTSFSLWGLACGFEVCVRGFAV